MSVEMCYFDETNLAQWEGEGHRGPLFSLGGGTLCQSCLDTITSLGFRHADTPTPIYWTSSKDLEVTP